MMSDSNSKTVDNSKPKAMDFGSVLASARKTKNYSVEEISEYLKIPARLIKALESNDIKSLPAPTYTQGYIRSCEKFLEIPEGQVLDLYNRAVPHDNVSDLKPRSNLPGEANSQSPIMKTITSVLIIAGVATLGFGGFQYYQEKADVVGVERETRQERFTGNSLDSPGENRLNLQQKTRLTENVQSDDAEFTADEVVLEETTASKQTTADDSRPSANTTDSNESVVPASGALAGAVANSDDVVARNENDIIEIFAENGSWVEVRDARNSRLLYNMLPAGSSKILLGRAPFSISMGNAKTTRLLVNNVEIDISQYIRANNTVNFKVSTQGENVIFH